MIRCNESADSLLWWRNWGLFVNRRSLFWGLAFLAGAVTIGLLARSPPQIGMAVFLGMLGITLILAANAEWFLRKTTRPEDYEGSCPVGESCRACGAFNYKPRRACRSCQGPVNQKQGS